LLAANICARATAQVQSRSARRQLRHLSREDLTRNRIFIADVDVDIRSFDNGGTNQRAFQKAVRIGVQEQLILESTGLAFIAVHRHESRAGLAPHRAPFASRRESRTAEAAERGVIEYLQYGIDRQRARTNPVERLISAGGT